MSLFLKVYEVAGYEAAERIRQELGGFKVSIPQRMPKIILARVVSTMRADGREYREIARSLKISVSTVRRMERYR